MEKPSQLINFFSNNSRYSDITFLVGPAEEPERQQIFNGHRILFAAKSEVFDAMFSSDIPIVNNRISITDTEPKTFELFMKYIYHQDAANTTLSFLNILVFEDLMKLVYLATKYLVQDLVLTCSDKIIWVLSSNGTEKMTANNALTIRKRMLEIIPDSSALNHVNGFIDASAEDIIATDEFLQVDQSTLIKFLESQTLNVGLELCLFKALGRWARQRCREKNLHFSAKNQREQMGLAIFQIRFPTMDFYTFSQEVCRKHLLTKEEVSDIIHYMNTKCTPPPLSIKEEVLECPPFSVECRPSTVDSLAKSMTPPIRLNNKRRVTLINNGRLAVQQRKKTKLNFPD